MKTIIHVNQAHIRANIRKDPSNREPVLTVKTYKSNVYANTVSLEGPSRVVYSPDKKRVVYTGLSDSTEKIAFDNPEEEFANKEY